MENEMMRSTVGRDSSSSMMCEYSFVKASKRQKMVSSRRYI